MNARMLIAPLYRSLERAVERVAVVGALRRREDVISPIEILVRPHASPADLFGEPGVDKESVRAAVCEWGEVTRETSNVLEAVARGTPNLRVMILYVAMDVSWGWAVLRRTGPLSFIDYMQKGLEARGIRLSAGGAKLLDTSSATLHADDEDTIFKLAAVPVIPPEERSAVKVPSNSPSATQVPSRTASGYRNRGEHQGRGMTIERDDEP